MKAVKVILVLPLHAHELDRAEKIEMELRRVVKEQGLSAPLEVIHRRLRPTEIPLGATIVSDCPSRLGRNTVELAKFLQIALQRGVNVVIGGYFHLENTQAMFREALTIIESLVRVNSLFRSKRTAEGVFLARSRGISIGRSQVPEKVKQRVREIYAELGSIRGTARALKKNGVEIGRTTVQRIVKSYKGSGNG